MQTKFLQLDGVQVAYIELNEKSTDTLFFLHGSSSSKLTWRKQLAGPLFENYRLIAIDLPWHGESGSLVESNCNLKGIARHLTDVINILHDNKPFLLCGVSLATNFIAEMLGVGLRPKAVVLAGPSMISSSYGIDLIMKPHSKAGVTFIDDPDVDEVTIYANEVSLSREKEDVIHFVQDFFRVKAPFRSVLGKSIFAGEYSDEIATLKACNLPLLLVYGRDEQTVDTNYLDSADLTLWGDRIHLIEGAGHLVHIDQPDGFNELLATFCNKAFK